MTDHSAIGCRSRRKGKVGEREFVHLLRDRGLPGARRTQQHSGIEGRIGDVEVPGLPVHFEVKREERLNVENAMQQAERDCPADRLPVVAHRRNKERWKITMRAEEFIKLVRFLDTKEN